MFLPLPIENPVRLPALDVASYVYDLYRRNEHVTRHLDEETGAQVFVNHPDRTALMVFNRSPRTEWDVLDYTGSDDSPGAWIVVRSGSTTDRVVMPGHPLADVARAVLAS